MLGTHDHGFRERHEKVKYYASHWRKKFDFAVSLGSCDRKKKRKILQKYGIQFLNQHK